MRKSLLIGIFLFLASPLLAGQVHIKEARLLQGEKDFFYLKVKLDGLFFPELKEALMEGIPITLSCSVMIERDRSILWDPVLWEGVYTRVIKYNLLTKTFVIKDPPEIEKSFSSFEAFRREAQNLLLPLPTRPLRERRSYIEVRVYRRTASLFFPFNLIYSLLSPAPADFETDKARVEVKQ